MNSLQLMLHTKRHPSAIFLLVQLLGMLLYPFIENAEAGHVVFNAFGIVVLGFTTCMVRRTSGLAWISASIAGPIIVLLAALKRNLPRHAWFRYTGRGRATLEVHAHIDAGNIVELKEAIYDWIPYSEDL